MSDRPQSINGWELQDSADPIQQKLMTHWETNKHLYENASQSLKGLWLLRLSLHWWEDPAMREHRAQIIEENNIRGTIDMLTFYEKAVGVEK